MKFCIVAVQNEINALVVVFIASASAVSTLLLLVRLLLDCHQTLIMRVGGLRYNIVASEQM
jgi:hypothetical protein